jgi:hypothetical protein
MRCCVIGAAFCAVAMSMYSGDVKAQSAEETVQFMLFGIENGRKPLGMDVNIVRVSDCQYTVGMSAQGQSFEWAFDFNNLSAYSVQRGPQNTVHPVLVGSKLIHFKGADAGKVQEGDFDTLDQAGLRLGFFLASADRMETAARYFRDKYCKGRAF